MGKNNSLLWFFASQQHSANVNADFFKKSFF